MAYKIDMHVHTHYSRCSNLAPGDIVRYARKAGLSGVAITDHNTVEGVKENGKQKDFLVIPGIEVSTSDGDLIGLFVTDVIKRDQVAPETADRIRDAGGLVVIPHPFDFLRKCCGSLAKEIKPDFIEVFNSRVVFRSANRKAEAAADLLGVKKIAGSDAHFKEEIGKSGVIVEGLEDFRNSLEKGDFELFEKASLPFVHVKSAINKVVEL